VIYVAMISNQPQGIGTLLVSPPHNRIRYKIRLLLSTTKVVHADPTVQGLPERIIESLAQSSHDRFKFVDGASHAQWK
jgi:hypothetical protein